MEPWAIILIVFGVFLFIMLLVVISNIRIVKQTNKYIIERFGGYAKTWGVGVHFLIPFVDRVAEVVSLKEQVKTADYFRKDYLNSHIEAGKDILNTL